MCRPSVCIYVRDMDAGVVSAKRHWLEALSGTLACSNIHKGASVAFLMV